MPKNNGFQEVSFLNDALLADEDLETASAVVSIAQVLPRGQLLGRITATGEVAAYNAAATNGLQTLYGVLAEAVDTTAGAYAATVYIAGAFKDSGITPVITPAIKDALRAINIYTRPTV